MNGNKPTMNENHAKRKATKERRWVDIIAEQFGGLTGSAVDKIKKRKQKLEDL